MLAHCQELARQLVAALRDLETLQPGEMQGLLDVVDATRREEPKTPLPRQGEPAIERRSKPR